MNISFAVCMSEVLPKPCVRSSVHFTSFYSLCRYFRTIVLLPSSAVNVAPVGMK